MAVTTSQVQQLYIAYFNRPADFFGLTFQTAQANQFGLQFVADQFSKSPEYIATYAGKGVGDVVDTIYLNLFGRHAEPAGLKFWGDLLSDPKSGITVGNAAITIANGAINDDKVSVANKLVAANAFYASLDTSAEIVGYSGDAANLVLKNWMSGITTQATLDAAITPAALLVVSNAASAAHASATAVSFSLSDTIDTFVGGAGNDSFTATEGKWTALDSVDGGAGTNTFTVAQTSAIVGAPAGATVKNITVMNVISGSTITLNASAYDVKTLNITAGGQSFVTAAATTDVNELGSTNFSNLFGGKNVTVNHSTLGDVYVEGAAGNATITSTKGTVQVKGVAGDTTVASKALGNVFADGKTLTVSTTGAVTRTTQTADVTAQSNAGTASSNATTAKGNAALLVTDMTALKGAITGSSTYAATAAATLTAYQAGEITREQKIAIDGAFATGLKTDAPTAVAAANAIVTPLVVSATAASAASVLAETSAIAAKSAADTVVANDTATGSLNATTFDVLGSKTLTAVSITGNFNGSTTFADNSTLSNTLTTVSLDHSGVATLTGNAITNVSMANTAKTVTVSNTTAGHTMNLTLSAASTGAGFTDNNAATVNVTSNGTATNRVDTFSATQAHALNITGAAGFRSSGLAAGLATDAVITATTSAGSNQVTVSAGQSYLGGTGTDTVTTSGTTAQAQVVSGGDGTADRLNVSDVNVIAANATTGAVNFSGFEILGVTGITADVRNFTNSTFTSVSSGGNATINGLNAAQAANVSVSATGSLTLGVVGATAVGQLDTVKITTLGSLGAMDLGNIGLNGVETLNLVANASGAGTTIGSLVNALALTGVTASGSGSLSLTTGAVALNVNTVIDASAVGGNVTIDARLSTANALKIIGTSAGSNTITTSTAGMNNVVVVGDATNSVTSYGGNDTITGGNGDNTINAGDGNNTITLGNGFNIVTSGIGNDTITVGSFGNKIDSGAGADKITLAAHAVGVVDTIVVAPGAAVAGANMDTITGFISGQDVLQVSAANLTGASLVTVSPTATSAVMLGVVTSATSVATVADVYAQLTAALNNSVGHEFAPSAGATVVAREVTFTTGAAAGTYLVINDSDVGFNATHDIVIKLVGNTTIVGNDIVIVA